MRTDNVDARALTILRNVKPLLNKQQQLRRCDWKF